MKLSLMAKLGPFIRESLSLSSPEYFCLLDKTEAIFLKVKTKKKVEVILQVSGDSSSLRFLEDFFKRLSFLNEYYGQPLTILINNSAAYSYIRILKERKLNQIAEIAKGLQNEEIKFSQVVRNDAKSPVFISQGIRKTYLAQLETVCERLKIPILDITTLPAYVTLNSPAPQLESCGISFYQFAQGKLQYLIRDDSGNVIPGQVNISEQENSLSNVVSDLREQFLCEEKQVNIELYSIDNKLVQKDFKSFQLASLLRQSANWSRKNSKYLHKTKSNKIARGFQIAINSARLLLLVLISICSISIASALITMQLASVKDQNITKYQNLYSNTMRLQTELDSLNQTKERIVSNHPEKTHAADILSAFCQKRYNDLYLSQISLIKLQTDTVRIEAKGMSKTESRVFTYHKQLNDEMGIYKLSLNSLKPEIQNYRETQDTVFVFNLSALVSETKR